MGENLSKHENNEKKRGWLLPPSKGQGLSAGLYLVATPIGNLGDMTLRALDTLSAADQVFCEDSRVSGKLLKHFGIEAKLGVYNDHSDARVREKVLGAIRDGQAIALISDAGMPMISDPGYKLVRACVDAGLVVTSVPGANAPLTAMQLSGLGSDAFSFIGFLPHKDKARQDVLKRWEYVEGALIAFESGPRLLESLKAIADVLGAREVAVARELTKLHEEVRRGDVAELVEYYEASGAPKGEIVLVISPPAQKEYSQDELKALLQEALKSNSTKAAAAKVAAKTGESKSKLYDLALKI